MQLKALFFDVDDTLFNTSEFARAARKAALEAMIATGLEMPLSALEKELDEVIAEFSSNYEGHFDKLLLRMPKSRFRKINPAFLVAAGVKAYHECKHGMLAPYPDVSDALGRLSRTELVLGIISAGRAVKQAEKLLRLGLYKYFRKDAIFISEQIGISKPNPKLFLRACTDLNLKPAACMVIGDHPLMDIDPPNRLGMATVLVKRGAKYAGVEGSTTPGYAIADFCELLDIIERDFGIEIPE